MCNYQGVLYFVELYGSIWTPYPHQSRGYCLRHILSITWRDRSSNTTVLDRTQLTIPFSLLRQRQLCWLGTSAERMTVNYQRTSHMLNCYPVLYFNLIIATCEDSTQDHHHWQAHPPQQAADAWTHLGSILTRGCHLHWILPIPATGSATQRWDLVVTDDVAPKPNSQAQESMVPQDS